MTLVEQKKPCWEVWEVRKLPSEHGTMMTGMGHSCRLSLGDHLRYHKCPCGAKKRKE